MKKGNPPYGMAIMHLEAGMGAAGILLASNP